MALRWNLDHYLNLTREIRWLQKNWRWHFRRFSSFRPIWSNPETESRRMVRDLSFFIKNCLVSEIGCKQLKNSWTLEFYPPNFEFFSQFSLRINQKSYVNIRRQPHNISSRTKHTSKDYETIRNGVKKANKVKERNFRRKKL